ncbi:MAG: DUF2783 domain-containing protein [Alkalilacustris sp.]
MSRSAPTSPPDGTPGLVDPEGFYADLLAVHEGLSPEDSAALNARLILLMAHRIGDRARLSEALQEAAQSGLPTPR